MDITIPAYSNSKSLLTGAMLALLCGLQTAMAQEPAPAPEQQQPESQPIITEEAAPRESSFWIASTSRSHWTFEIKGGHFETELDEWEAFYGGDRTAQAGLLAGYKFLPQVEVGLAIDYIHDEGTGFLPINNQPGGVVDFQMYPAHAYVMLRGVFFENQWVVPYVGGGITRVYYRQEIENQASVRGDVDGDHARAGLQILLDWFDSGSAAGFEEEGVENTYLTFEVLSFSAEIDGIELGGESALFGFAFEF